MNTTTKFPFRSPNGRHYRVLRLSSIDGYVWVEFEDNIGIEVQIMQHSNSGPEDIPEVLPA